MIARPATESALQENIGKHHYLDVLRGIAALCVLVSHADHAGLINIVMSNPTKVFLGRLGVYLFFILSGYLIWKSAQGIRHGEGIKTYAIHRVTRLVPLYLVNIAFVIWALPHLSSAFQAHVTIETIIRHLFFTQDFNPSVSRDLNPVLWTLTHEVVFYVMVPLLLWVRIWMLPLLGGACIMLSWIPSTASTVLAFFHLFIVGILMAERRIGWAGLALLIFAIMQAHGQFAYQEFAARLAAGGLFIASLTAPARGLWWTAPLRWIGIVSFSLYIWHYLFINILGTQTGLRVMHAWSFGLSGNGWIRGVLFIGMVLIISTASYYLIERPSMGVFRRWLITKTNR